MTTVLSPSGVELPDGGDPHSRAQVNRNFTKINDLWNKTVGIGAAIKGRLSVGNALVGTNPTLANQQNGSAVTYTQSGTFVGSTDAAGNLAINYNEAFPNSVCTFIACNGDHTIPGRVDVAGSPFTFTLSTGYVHVSNNDGTAKASTTVRINWIATGS